MCKIHDDEEIYPNVSYFDFDMDTVRVLGGNGSGVSLYMYGCDASERCKSEMGGIPVVMSVWLVPIARNNEKRNWSWRGKNDMNINPGRVLQPTPAAILAAMRTRERERTEGHDK